MRPDNQIPLRALVKCGPTPDTLLLASRDRQALYGALKRARPDAGWRLGADGVSLDSLAADVLQNTRPLIELDWERAAEKVAINRAHARASHQTLLATVRAIVSGGASAARDLVAHAAEDILDEHQLVNVACMTLPDSFGLCVFDEQGAGKTVTTIYAYDALVERDVADLALIVAPKSMVSEWPVDFERFTSGRYSVRTMTGSRAGKRETLASGADVLVTNYETIVQLESEITSLLSQYEGRVVLVVDESFYAKNLDAQRTLAIRRLREWCGRAFVLCGTPAPNAPHDLIQQFTIVDFGITFSRVAVPEDREAARPIIQRAIEDRGLFVRHLKSDVLPDLPGKRFSRVTVPLQDVQQHLYDQARDGLIRDVRAIDEQTFQRQLANFLARRMALLQICSNPSMIVPGYDEVPAKLLALDELLSELIERRGEKVVLWSFFTKSIERIEERFQRFKPVRYDGSVSDTTLRRQCVKRFQEDCQTMLLVANPAAAGAGLTLHRARFAIYESFSNQAAHYLQSLDRIHRRGQDRPVEYIVLLTENTVEQQEYDRLLRKENAARQLLGDPAPELNTRDTFLTDLLGVAGASVNGT